MHVQCHGTVLGTEQVRYMYPSLRGWSLRTRQNGTGPARRSEVADDLHHVQSLASAAAAGGGGEGGEEAHGGLREVDVLERLVVVPDAPLVALGPSAAPGAGSSMKSSNASSPSDSIAPPAQRLVRGKQP